MIINKIKLIIGLTIINQIVNALLCDPKCIDCDDSDTCYQCQGDYELEQSQKYCISTCSSGQYYNGESSKCQLDCPNGFTKDSQRNICRSVNKCHSVNYIGGNEDFKFNVKAQLYKDILIISGQQNQTVKENYLKVYKITDSEYGLQSMGILNGHDSQIISFILNNEEGYDHILISVSKKMIVAWDMKYGLMKSNITLENYLYVNSDTFYLDYNFLVINFFDMTQFAIFSYKDWIKTLFSHDQSQLSTSKFFRLCNKVHSTPIFGFKAFQNNYLLSFDESNQIIKWDLQSNTDYKIFQGFDNRISTVITFPNDLNEEFFILTFVDRTDISFICNVNENYQALTFKTDHTSKIINILYDKNISSDQTSHLISFISISQSQIIVFSFDFISQQYSSVISFSEQILFVKILNNQVIAALSNGLNKLEYSKDTQTPMLKLVNILPNSMSQSDFISDIVTINIKDIPTFIIIGRKLASYQALVQPDNTIQTKQISYLIQKSKYYERHYGKVNGVVMDVEQKLYISYSSDGSFGVWDTVKNNILHQKPLRFQLPPWCIAKELCSTGIKDSIVIKKSILLCIYTDNTFITWNFNRLETSLRKIYYLPSKWLPIVNYGFFNKIYLFMSNNKELQIFNFSTSETQIINNNYQVFTDKINQVQLGFINSTYYLIEAFVNAATPPQAQLRIKYLSNFTVNKTVNIEQQCMELEYFQQTQRLIVNYYSKILTILYFPYLNSTKITADSDIVTQQYVPSQDRFLIITKTTVMSQYLPYVDAAGYGLESIANIPIPRKNFAIVSKEQLSVTSFGYTYFQNTGFPLLDNQVINLVFLYLKTCSVFPFKEEISSVSVVNDQLTFIGFSNGDVKIAQYVCSQSSNHYFYANCNTKNTIHNPNLRQSYIFDIGKVISLNYYSKVATSQSYGHTVNNDVVVIQDTKNNNMITYSRDTSKNLYKFNQRLSTATEFQNGHTTAVEIVFLDADSDVVISHSVNLTDLKVIVWSYSYNIQNFHKTTPITSIVRAVIDIKRKQVMILTNQGTLFIFDYINYQVKQQFLIQGAIEFWLDDIYKKFYILYNTYYIQVRSYETLSLQNEFITFTPLRNQKIISSGKYIHILSIQMITIIDRHKQLVLSTISCKVQCLDFLISDKLNQTFTYVRDDSDSIDVYENQQGSYLYSIFGQQDLDIGSIKLIVIDEINYLLFIGKLSKYITVYFNYLTRQYVGYSFDSIFLFWGTTMIPQFNALNVADTQSFYVRSIQEQITSTFKFQDLYKVKYMDNFTNTKGDIFYIDGSLMVRRYRKEDSMVKIVNQLGVYREIKFYNGFLFILTYTSLLKYSEDCLPLTINSSIDMNGDIIIGTLNNQIFISTFSNTILQIDYDQFIATNTITLPAPLAFYQFVEDFNDLLLITTGGVFIRYNYVKKTTLMQLNGGYYYTQYNINLALIFLISTSKSVIEAYPYNRIITNFTNYKFSNTIAYSNSTTLNYLFIDELFNTLYAVSKSDRVIDIYSFSRNILSPELNITKQTYIPYINSIDSVILEIEGDYIKVQVPWTISYYRRNNYNYYWQVQDSKFIQSIRQYIRHPTYPELIFLSQNNFIVIAYQDLANQIFKPLIQQNLDYPNIIEINIKKNYDLYLIKLLILVSGDILIYDFNIPIINQIPQEPLLNECLMQIQNPNSGYFVENQLTYLQNYFRSFSYLPQRIKIEIYGSPFLYFNKIMDELNAEVTYLGNEQQSILNLEENLFLESKNEEIQILDTNLKLMPKPVRALFSPETKYLKMKNVDILQSASDQITNTSIIIKDMNNIEISNVKISSLNFYGGVSLFDVQNCKNFVMENIDISNIQVYGLESIFRFVSIDKISITNMRFTSLKYTKTSTRQLVDSELLSSLLVLYKVNNLVIENTSFLNISGYDEQSIIDIKQNQNIIFNNNKFNQIHNIKSISYQNYFKDEISTTIENNDFLLINNTVFSDYQHTSISLISFQGTTLHINNSTFNQISCNDCIGSSLYLLKTKNVNIRECQFTFNTGYNGGSIAIVQSIDEKIEILDSVFSNNLAINNGGAIYLIESYVRLSNVSFTNNHALIGGAIRYLNYKPKEFNSEDFQKNQVTFSNNSADIHSQNWGSYLQYVGINQINSQEKRILKSNLDSEGGQRYLSSLEQSQYVIKDIQSGGFVDFQFSIYDEENHLLAYDVQNCKNQVYSDEICEELSQIKLTVQTLEDSLVRVVGSYTAQYSEFDQPTKSFKILGVQFIGNPQSTQKVFLQVNGIKQFQQNSQNLISQSNKNFYLIQFLLLLFKYNFKNKTVSQTSYQVPIVLTFRECKVGEIFKQINQIYECNECIVGTYSIEIPNKDTLQSCKPCPQEASYCYRNQMQLKEGYWKSSNYTSNILKCEVLKNCNGDDTTNYCSQGHYGPICQFCDENGKIWDGDKFQYDNDGGCVNCTKQSIIYQIGQTSLITTIMIIYCLFNIISALKAAEKIIQAYYLRIMKLSCISRSCQNNEDSLSIKALTNFLQLYKIISTYTLNLPFIINLFPNLFGSPGDSIIFSNSCEISQFASSEMPVLYWKSLFMIISPLIYMAIISIVYLAFLYKRFYSHIALVIFSLFIILFRNYIPSIPPLDIFLFMKQNSQQNRRVIKKEYNIKIFIQQLKKQSHIICAFVFLFQFVQPNIVQNLIAQMSCKEFDGKFYVASDYTYECYSVQHQQFIFFLIGPALALQGFILPALILIVIMRSKHKLNNAIIRLRYGYVYQDYHRNGFYWEFVKYTLKLSIILVQNFFDVSQPKKKFIIIFMIVMVYYTSLVLIRPYQMQKYQRVDENSTLVILIITILNYFLNNGIPDYQKYLFYVILLSCQYTNQGFLVFQIIKIWFDKYIQIFVSKLPNNMKNSLCLKKLMKKSDIHPQPAVEKATKLWMLVYKRSRLFQSQNMKTLNQKDTSIIINGNKQPSKKLVSLSGFNAKRKAKRIRINEGGEIIYPKQIEETQTIQSWTQQSIQMKSDHTQQILKCNLAKIIQYSQKSFLQNNSAQSNNQGIQSVPKVLYHEESNITDIDLFTSIQINAPYFKEKFVSKEKDNPLSDIQ